MTSRRKQIALSIAVLIAASLTASTANASSYRHIDILAVKMQRQSAKLYHEFRLHFRHTPEYRHLMSDARDLYYKSKHVHEVAHHRESLHHIKRDLAALDRLFHHLEELVEKITHDADHHGHGHIHGDTHHVEAIMKRFEQNLHHLRRDVKRMVSHHDHHLHHGHGVPMFRGAHGYKYKKATPHVGFRVGGTNVSFGGNGVRFNFGR